MASSATHPPTLPCAALPCLACSVCSLRSNLDNHPGRISEPRSRRRRSGSEAAAGDAAPGAARPLIRLDARGIPMGVLPRRGAGAAPESGGSMTRTGGAGEGEEGEEEHSEHAAALERRKDETAEEKRARKAAVKEAQRVARTQKKELKGMFKEALVQAQRRAATAQPQARIKLPS